MLTQIIQKYRFDLTVADTRLSNVDCHFVFTTFKTTALCGKGIKAIQKILDIATYRGVAKDASVYPNGATFQEFLFYLQKRTA